MASPLDFFNKNSSSTGLRITDVINEHKRSGTVGQSVRFHDRQLTRKPQEGELSTGTRDTEINFFERTSDSFRALKNKEFSFKDVLREVPSNAVDVPVSIAQTIAPALTNFVDTTGSIFGEGLAYAFDQNVREQFRAGNLDILPTISETTLPKLAKYTIAAGLEAAIFRSIPNVARANLGKAGLGGVGALEGIGFAITEGLANDETPEEILRKMPLYGVTGGALGVLTPYLVPLLKSEVKYLPKQFKDMVTNLNKEVDVPPTRMLDVDDATPSPTAVPVSTPSSRYAQYLRTQGYEPYVPEGKLPTIEAGSGRVAPTADDALPTIQFGDDVPTPRPTPAGTRLVPEPEPGAPTTPARREAPAVADTPAPSEGPTTKAPKVEATDAPVVKVPSRQLPVGEGKTKASKLESRLRQVTDDPNTPKLEGERAATFQQVSKADQMKRASKFVQDSPDDAMAVLRGDIDAPEGLLDNSIALALAKNAELTNDGALAIRLASLRSTRAGQEISMLTEADPTGVVSQIEEVIKARKGKVARGVKGSKDTAATASKETTKVKAEAKKAVSAAQLKIEDAEKLLNDILC